MFIEKRKKISDVIYTFKQKEEYVIGIQAFKRRNLNDELPTIYVKGLEQFSAEHQNEFLQAITIEMGKGKIEQAQGDFLAGDNQTWFNVVQIGRKNGDLPYGEYCAFNAKTDEQIAKLVYVGRRALISGKTEFLVSVSKNDAPNGVHKQLFEEFITGVAADVNLKENKNGKGLIGFIAVEENNEQAKKLVENISASPKNYDCEFCKYFGQNEEDYSEGVHYFRAISEAKTAKEEVEKARVL